MATVIFTDWEGDRRVGDPLAAAGLVRGSGWVRTDASAFLKKSAGAGATASARGKELGPMGIRWSDEATGEGGFPGT